MNAKEELLEVVRDENLKILKIDCHFEFDSDLPCRNITTLEDLDVEYDETFGIQLLYGEVYCIDKNTHKPVWLTRSEYDGSEWWNINRTPEFYSTNAEYHKTRMSWISVEEGYPPFDKDNPKQYLVRVKRGNVKQEIYYMVARLVSRCHFEFENGLNEVTHWRPIPSFDDILEANKDVLKRLKEKGD